MFATPLTFPPYKDGFTTELIQGEDVSDDMFEKMFELQKRVPDLYPGQKNNRSFWRSKTRGTNAFNVVIFKGDDLVSLASCFMYKTVKGKPVLYIATFMTDQEVRGAGLGTALWQTCVDIVKSCNPIAIDRGEYHVGCVFAQLVTTGDGLRFWRNKTPMTDGIEASLLALQASMSDGWFEPSRCAPKAYLLHRS